MVRDTYITKNIRNVHPDVRSEVVAQALKRGVTISDIVGETIAQAWSLPYEYSGERSIGVDLDGTQLNVRIPQEMATRIYAVSRAHGLTESSFVQELLAERYEIEYAPVKRGGETRRKKVSSG